MKHLKTITILILLQLAIDFLYVYLYPSVNPIRATLIGLTALFMLYVLPFQRLFNVHPLIGSLAIYSSAFFGALLVGAEVLKSKSFLSAAVHIAILIAIYALTTVLGKNRIKKE